MTFLKNDNINSRNLKAVVRIRILDYSKDVFFFETIERFY